MPAPAAKTRVSEGRSEYQALTNLSVPQRSPETGLLTGQNDLVERGNTVRLTEAEAANLMATGGKTGRQHPAVRPYRQRAGEMPRLTARQMSGVIRQPVTPPPGDTGPRPDPPGSSTVRIVEAGPEPPELGQPQPGSETVPDLGAIDLPPRSQAT